MKKTLILILFFSSCHLPRYTHSGNVNSSLDFNEGRWVLNEIESPENIKSILTRIATEEFTDLLNDRFSVLKSKRSFLLGENTNDYIKSTLKSIKDLTRADFFINIKAKRISNEISSIRIGEVDSSIENSGSITVEIYDLNLLEKVYTQSVNGNTSILKDNSDFALVKSTDNLILAGLGRIMRKIKKNRKR